MPERICLLGLWLRGMLCCGISEGLLGFLSKRTASGKALLVGWLWTVPSESSTREIRLQRLQLLLLLWLWLWLRLLLQLAKRIR